MHLVKFVIRFAWANFKSVEVSLKKQQKIKQFSKTNWDVYFSFSAPWKDTKSSLGLNET